MKFIFASHNAHKAAEIKRLLPGAEILSLSDINYHEEIPETGSTLRENALIKAQTIFDIYGNPVFADDTGLMVEALDGDPGVYSARYAGSEANSDKNMEKLLRALKDKENRAAHFATVIAFIDASGQEYFFEGRVDGEILIEKTGSGGFGYDPVFKPKGYSQSFAQMNTEAKNEISHRGRALQKFIQFIQQRDKKN